MKTFVTFGYAHRHKINGKVFDKDCVAVINARNAAEGRKKAFEYFGEKFCFEYPEDCWDEKNLMYFLGGMFL